MDRARILLVEHHRDLREALAEALLDDGYVVTAVGSVHAALVAIRSASETQLPNAVVLDALHDEDLGAVLRADPRWAAIARVSIGFASDPVSEGEIRVRRPFRVDEFLDAVRRALEGPRHDAAGDPLSAGPT